jgi:chitinase
MRKLALVAALWLFPASAFADGLNCNSGDLVGYTSGFVCTTAARQVKTIATLPTCNSAARGLMYVVTDALLPAALATVGAGGAVVVGVMCNGTNWIVQ